MNKMTRAVEPGVVPVSANLAEGPIGLIRFAQLAGRNMLEVIPAETLRKTYVRGPLNIHYIGEPDMVMELLVGEGRAFPKAKFTKDIIGSAVGNGLILAEGEKWRRQRQRYSPLFAVRNLPILSQYFAETGLEVASSLAAHPGEVDFVQVAPAATLANISRVMFSGTADVSSEQIRAGLKRYFEYISKISLFDVMGLPKWLPRKKWFRSKAPVTTMRDLARHVIEVRRAEQRPEPLDFLDLLIKAVDDDFEDLETTVDNLLTFVVAGHETSANAIAWGFYLLTIDPGMQERIREEIVAVRPEGPITYDDVQKTPLLHAHVQETLRLYPSAAFFARDADKDVDLGDVQIKAGDALFFSVYSLHRNEVLWDHPDEYRPERFLGDPLPRGQFIPFGDGPRICIGAQYALTEIKILMASVLREVRVRSAGHEAPTPVLTFTMRPGGPMILEVEPLRSA
jgi:cytochrome P450